jgi:hypothetical protein
VVGHLKLPLENVDRLVSACSCRKLYSLASRTGSSIYYSKARLMARTPGPRILQHTHTTGIRQLGVHPCGLTVLLFESATTILT